MVEELARRCVLLDVDVAAVIAKKGDKLVMLRQKRPFLGREIIEIPAGHVEPRERPEDAALRELEEETGYICEELQKILEFHPVPGISSKKTHLFFAENLSRGMQKLDQDEELEVLELTKEKAFGLIGQAIVDAKTIIALLWCERRGII